MTAALSLTAALLSAYPASRLPSCDPDNGGITLPDGFCAVVVADQVGRARHVAVAPNGDLFVALENGRGAAAQGGVLALRDTNGDGKADVRESAGPGGGTGIALGKGAPYFSTPPTGYRFALPAGRLKPGGAPGAHPQDLPRGRHQARHL